MNPECFLYSLALAAQIVSSCYFLFLDKKKVTKEKSRQNNASTRWAIARPLFCQANTLF
jgi:hypothetical protein